MSKINFVYFFVDWPVRKKNVRDWVSKVDYRELMLLSLESIKKWHPSSDVYVYTDLTTQISDGFKVIRHPFKGEETGHLMVDIVQAQLMYLESWSFDADTIFLSPDCVVNRDCKEVFDADFDLGVTIRKHEIEPVNNGVMYAKRGGRAVDVFRRALDLVNGYEEKIKVWHGDQRSISEALMPMPNENDLGIHERMGCKIAFFEVKTHADSRIYDPNNKAYIIHYKGPERKKVMKSRHETS